MKLIESLGPQNPGDGPLLRRLRLHQSWFRADALKLSRWGATRGPAAKELGSLLAEPDAVAGFNFVNPSAFRLYKVRHAEGWGIDPRSSIHMTSSQALTINLVGLLGQDDSWFVGCLNTWLGRSDLYHVANNELEFAPALRSLHLNDQTRIDILLTALGANGPEVIAVEVKYGDRFNSRRVDIDTARYRNLARASELWADPAGVMTNPRVNQLARVHALATSYARSEGVTLPVSMVVVAHQSDTGAQEVVREYEACVNGPSMNFVPLRDLCAPLLATAPRPHRPAAEHFVTRYGSEDGSVAIQQVLEECGGGWVA